MLRLAPLESRSVPASLVAAGGVVFVDAAPLTPFPGYAGPLAVALAGDLDGNGYQDILVGAGEGGGPRVALVDGKTGDVLANFFAFEPTFAGGVSVAYDGAAGLIYVGAGKGGGPVVATYDAATLAEKSREFYGDPADRHGVSVDADSGFLAYRNPDVTLGEGAYRVYLNFQGLKTAGDGEKLAADVYAFFAPLQDVVQLVTKKPADFPGDYLTVAVGDDLSYLPASYEGTVGYASSTVTQPGGRYEPRTVYATAKVGNDARVAVHEIGHFFGLAHSGDRGNVMYPTVLPSYAPAAFDAGQLAAMRAAIAGRP